MNSAERIITKFGGLNPMARKMTEALGKPYAASTIQHWQSVGYVPHPQQKRVLKAAKFHGIALKPSEFSIFEAAE